MTAISLTVIDRVCLNSLEHVYIQRVALGRIWHSNVFLSANIHYQFTLHVQCWAHNLYNLLHILIYYGYIDVILRRLRFTFTR